MEPHRGPSWLPQRQPQQALAIFGIVGVLSAIVIAVLVASGGSAKPRTETSEAMFETTTDTTPTAPPPPVESTPTSPPPTTSTTPTTPPHPPLLRSLGQTGTDEGIDFTVKSIQQVKRVTRNQFGGSPPLRARGGGSLVRAAVDIHNGTQAGADPFCGGTSAHLVDDRGHRYETVDNLFEVTGNDAICSGAGTPAGADASVTLVFRLPRGRSIGALELWNGKTDDYDGAKSLVRFIP